MSCQRELGHGMMSSPSRASKSSSPLLAPCCLPSVDEECFATLRSVGGRLQCEREELGK